MRKRKSLSILKICLENFRYCGQIILWRSSFTCFSKILKQSCCKHFVIFSFKVTPCRISTAKPLYILIICIHFPNKYVIWNLWSIRQGWYCCRIAQWYSVLCFENLNLKHNCMISIETKWSQKFCNFFPDGTPCWIFRAKTISFKFLSTYSW